jgi:hypothetical protein
MGSHSPSVSRCGILPGLFGITEMNERILNLVGQARIFAWENETHWSANLERDKLFEQKFAELIVKECAQVCLAQRDPANLNYKPSEKFAEAVKQHFGVEE